jgi:hypothetical protein
MHMHRDAMLLVGWLVGQCTVICGASAAQFWNDAVFCLSPRLQRWDSFEQIIYFLSLVSWLLPVLFLSIFYVIFFEQGGFRVYHEE